MPVAPTPAVVLLSGGLDSAVVLALAVRDGRACHALTLDYGQRHRDELAAAHAVAASLGAASHAVVTVDLRAIGGSALTADLDVPRDREPGQAGDIPITYVPARNLVFLSLAIAHAEVVGAREVHIGANAIDYSGYPDCRPEFLESFERTAALATRAGAMGERFAVRAPLVDLSKAQIVRLGTGLGVDFSLTRSCYDPAHGGLACGRCDACVLRRRGFEGAGVPDPTRYASAAAGR